MAASAIVDVPDAFFQMLCPDLRRLMLMAAITRVRAKLASCMTGRATGVVRTGQREKAGVIEGRRLPRFLGMTLRAGIACLRVNLRGRRAMACRAAGADVGLQQIMRESAPDGFDQSRAGMIGMASHAIGLSQCLMERNPSTV